jgi:hypothetical protein
MKITKAYLKKVIKEELLKESRDFGRAPIPTSRGSIVTHDVAASPQQRQAKLEAAMEAAASLSNEMTAILSNVDIDDRASLKAAYEKAKRVGDAVPRTLFDLDYDIDPTHYFLDDEDLEYEDPRQDRTMRAQRRAFMSPKEPYNADKLRANK